MIPVELSERREVQWAIWRSVALPPSLKNKKHQLLRQRHRIDPCRVDSHEYAFGRTAEITSNAHSIKVQHIWLRWNCHTLRVINRVGAGVVGGRGGGMKARPGQQAQKKQLHWCAETEQSSGLKAEGHCQCRARQQAHKFTQEALHQCSTLSDLSDDIVKPYSLTPPLPPHHVFCGQPCATYTCDSSVCTHQTS